MTLVRYALDRFRRMYLADPTLTQSDLLDFVLLNVVLPDGGDIHELINWYETRASELREASGIAARSLPDDCTCTVDPCCPLHGPPHVPRAT